MRTLCKNKQPLWIVEPIGEVELKDLNGDYTGEFAMEYSTPVKIFVNIYPNDGSISADAFGLNVSVDMIATSDYAMFTEESLIFAHEPSGDYQQTYDYMLGGKLPSLNSYTYALTKRI